MASRGMGSVLTAIAAVALILTPDPTRLWAQGAAENSARALRERAAELMQQNKYDEAGREGEKALAVAKREFGPDHQETAKVIGLLCGIYKLQGTPAAAERAVEACDRYLDMVEPLIKQKQLTPDNPQVEGAMGVLLMALEQNAHFDRMETQLKRFIGLIELTMGTDHPQSAGYIAMLAHVERQLGRSDEATALERRASEIAMKALRGEYPGFDLQNRKSGEPGPTTKPELLGLLDQIAAICLGEGRAADAVLLLEFVVKQRSKDEDLDEDKSWLLTSLNELGEAYEKLGKPDLARQTYERAVAAGKKAQEKHSNDDRIGLALRLARLKLKNLPIEPERPSIKNDGWFRDQDVKPKSELERANSLDAVASELEEKHRYAEAEPIRREIVSIRERVLGKYSPDLAMDLYRLGRLYGYMGRKSEERELYGRQQAVMNAYRALRRQTDIGKLLDEWENFQHLHGRYTEFEWSLMRKVVQESRERAPSHPLVQATLATLARNYFTEKDWANAVTLLTRVADTAIAQSRRMRLGVQTVLQPSDGVLPPGWRPADGDAWASRTFPNLVKASYRLAEQDPSRAVVLREKSFMIAQGTQNSVAALALSQMALRAAQRRPELRELARKGQDLAREWSSLDGDLRRAIQASPDRRDRGDEDKKRQRMAEIDVLLKKIDEKITDDFPEFAQLANAEPLSVESVRSLLGEDEALVLFLDTHAAPSGEKLLEEILDDSRPATPEETFVWVITRNDMRWARSDIGADALQNKVESLRCGLDRTYWTDPCSSSSEEEKKKQATRRRACASLTGKATLESRDLEEFKLPYDLLRAHQLYSELFGSVKDLIEGKSLLVVPSGALKKFPLQALVTSPPDISLQNADAYSAAAWFGTRQPITILPTVASLAAMRKTARPTESSKPFIGFGNPLLDGEPVGHSDIRKKAIERQDCAAAMAPDAARDAQILETRGTPSCPGKIREWRPLPDTARELCDVARSLGASDEDVRLGARMTKDAIRTLNDQGQLGRFRVVHFATHGLVSGAVEGLKEPALILTPPENDSGTSDGLLTASDVALLKLDADWVVMSACNTAAGEKDGADDLSGLARAFFYAGARAVLVSHWEVESRSAVGLITGAFEKLKADPAIGRAEALRLSMKAQIERSGDHAYPARWAPFVVVGEGGRGR